MKESVTYQAIVEEGEIKEARKALLLVGRELLGKPDAATTAAVNALGAVAQLEELMRRAVHAQSWSELLGIPAPRRTRRRRSTR